MEVLSEVLVSANESKDKFYEELGKMRSTARKNSVFLTDERYERLIKEVRSAKVSKKKMPRHYWLLNRYEVLDIKKKTKLIKPVEEGSTTIQYYVSDGELFDILEKTHLSLGHAGRDPLLKKLAKKYRNITRSEVELFLRLCKTCRAKQRRCKKGASIKPIINSELNSRGQIDLIDFQNYPDGDKKFILVFQDLSSKFIALEALRSKCTKEVAYKLVNILSLLGSPSILQSDCGREFVSQVVYYLRIAWRDLSIVHGTPTHGLRQGGSDNVTQEIKNLLTSWMQENKTGNWSAGLPFIQLRKNLANNTSLKMTPYEALFGREAKIGLGNSNLPHDLVENLTTEEQLKDLIESIEVTEQKNEARDSSNSAEQIAPPTVPVLPIENTPCSKNIHQLKEDKSIEMYENIQQNAYYM